MMAEEGHIKPVSEWDLEELGRGYPRNKDGTFARRRATDWLAPAVQAERMKRLKQASHDALMTHASDAMKVLGLLVNDPATPAGVRADIGKFIYEQLHGKAKAHVDVDAKVGPRDAIAAAIVLDDGLPQDAPLVLEGEFTEEEDDPGDAPMPGVDDEENRMPRPLREAHKEGRIL
ncbi:hypothetical protein SAMN05443287_106193 [Micromonospora phaseoli]|uniref:Uncharacterized protein n=1 Tax=Micromonospora phaseoli TaxID=1144548 RepID=A0A1H7AK88_9ACTN|nr:hypothetical protein [Micromonospora phaseoli]PZV96317.1 hypothetical protein CLV64_107195 [Micromonospora phaseoli]SEJ66051.1 hypothetical protein SAMN05443287_106193 [Micromonospora phaseoli]